MYNSPYAENLIFPSNGLRREMIMYDDESVLPDVDCWNPDETLNMTKVDLKEAIIARRKRT